MPAESTNPIARAIAGCSTIAAIVLGLLSLVALGDEAHAPYHGPGWMAYLLLAIGAGLVAGSALGRIKRIDPFLVVALAVVGLGSACVGASLVGLMLAGMP